MVDNTGFFESSVDIVVDNTGYFEGSVEDNAVVEIVVEDKCTFGRPP